MQTVDPPLLANHLTTEITDITTTNILPIVHLITDIHHPDHDNIPTNETTNTENVLITTDHHLDHNLLTITDKPHLQTITEKTDIINHHSVHIETKLTIIHQTITTVQITGQTEHNRTVAIHLHLIVIDRNHLPLHLIDHTHLHQPDNPTHINTEITDHQYHHPEATLTQVFYQV